MRRIWPLAIATFISDFGSSLTLSALPVIFLASGRKDGIGIYNGFGAAGALVGSIWAMAFLDRFRRNRVAALSDVIRALLLIPLIFSGKISIPMIAVYAVVEAVFGSTTTSAIQAWIAEHPMGEGELKKANSLIETGSQIARAMAPAAGVAIVALSNAHMIFALDAITFVIGAIFVARLKSQLPLDTPTSSSLRREVKDGLHYSVSNRLVMRWISVSMIHALGLALINTVYLTILSDHVMASEEQVAFYQTAYFVGSFLGSLTSLLTRQSPKQSLFCGSGILAVVMISAIFVSNYWIFFLLGAFQTFATLLTVIATRTLVQQSAETQYLGRVMAFRGASIDVASITAYIVAVFLNSRANTSSLLVMASLSFAISIVLIRPGIKTNI